MNGIVQIKLYIKAKYFSLIQVFNVIPLQSFNKSTSRDCADTKLVSNVPNMFNDYKSIFNIHIFITKKTTSKKDKIVTFNAHNMDCSITCL